MPIERNGRKYGDSTLIGESGQRITALDLAWSEACPVGRDLVKPVSLGGRGPEVMKKRYGEVIFWFKYLTEELKSPEINKPEIAAALTTPRRRLAGEPLGVHSKNWLPSEMTTLVFRSHAGYVLPRLLVEYMNVRESEKADRMEIGLHEFELAAKRANNETELVVFFAEFLASGENRELSILRRLLSTGKLGEDNLYTAYKETLETVRASAPILWECYQSLSPDQLDELKIFRA